MHVYVCVPVVLLLLQGQHSPTTSQIYIYLWIHKSFNGKIEIERQNRYYRQSFVAPIISLETWLPFSECKCYEYSIRIAAPAKRIYTYRISVDCQCISQLWCNCLIRATAGDVFNSVWQRLYTTTRTCSWTTTRPSNRNINYIRHYTGTACEIHAQCSCIMCDIYCVHMSTWEKEKEINGLITYKNNNENSSEVFTFCLAIRMFMVFQRIRASDLDSYYFLLLINLCHAMPISTHTHTRRHSLRHASFILLSWYVIHRQSHQ